MLPPQALPQHKGVLGTNGEDQAEAEQKTGDEGVGHDLMLFVSVCSRATGFD